MSEFQSQELYVGAYILHFDLELVNFKLNDIRNSMLAIF